MAITYETLQNGKIKEINSYVRPDGVDVVEKTTFKLSEAESIVARQISDIERQQDALQVQIDALKKKRDDLAALRPVQ